MRPPRALPRPASVHWELTQACGGACLHCRVDAGRAAPGELSRTEALAVADQIIESGTRRVVLTGGDPALFPGWKEIVAQLVGGGLSVEMFVGDAETVDAAVDAGVSAFLVSVDGPEQVHDALRPPAGSYRAAMSAIAAVSAQQRPLEVVTTATRTNIDSLERLYLDLLGAGVRRWRVQLVQLLGRAARDHVSLRPDPHQLEVILVVLMRAAREGRIEAPLHCSVGYLVPEEVALRGRDGRGPPVWQGNRAGLSGYAILADGAVVGCACLPAEFAVANVRDRSLAAIWSDDGCFPYTRQWDPAVLGGACVACTFAATCRAGCLGVAWGASGSIGHNPFCLKTVRSAVSGR